MIKYKILILTSGKKKITETIQKLIHKKAKHYEIKAVCSDKNTKLRNNISFINTNKSKKESKILKIIKSKKINFIISFTYKWILSERILKAVNYRSFNIHGAKLSEYRGNHTSIFPILDGKKYTYVELHHMNKFCDSGKIIASKKIKISLSDNGETLSDKIIINGLSILIKFIEKDCKNFKRIENFINKAPLKKKLNSKFIKTNSIIGLKKIVNLKNTKEIFLKTRAFDWNNYEPAYIVVNKKKIYLRFKK